MTGRTDQLLGLLQPAVAQAGYDLEDVAITAAGRRSVVRVVVDRDGGIDLDAVAEVSRLVGSVLDDSGVMGESAYVLEVTSPGIDRPLREQRHWRRAAGRLVQTSHDGATVTGRVVSVDEQSVTLDVGGQPRSYPLGELGAGAVQVEFSGGPA